MMFACGSHATQKLQWDVPPSETIDVQSLEDRYPHVVSQWTQRGEIFEHLEGQLFVEATCLSPTFEHWRAHWHNLRQSLTSKEGQLAKQALIQRSRNQHLFFVAIATQNQSSNDLRPRGSSLKAHLIVDQEVFEPQWINELTMQERLNVAVDFPYLSPLYKAYWVSFPKQTLNKEFILRISSLRGTLSLHWSLTKTP